MPPVPGLGELEGVWGNREVTGMKAVPRRLLIWAAAGGRRDGPGRALLGGEVVLVEGAERLLAREPAPLGEALGEVLRGTGSSWSWVSKATAARRDGDDYVLALGDGRELRGDRLLVSTAGARACRGSGWRRSASRRTRTASRSTPTCARGEGLWAIGDVNGVGR